tara:strand:- start:2207 stop:2365 length:159 start_codon:yes stop_codon:yes gene_type:complete
MIGSYYQFFFAQMRFEAKFTIICLNQKFKHKKSSIFMELFWYTIQSIIFYRI